MRTTTLIMTVLMVFLLGACRAEVAQTVPPPEVQAPTEPLPTAAPAEPTATIFIPADDQEHEHAADPVTEDGAYYMAISYTLSEEGGENAPTPPENHDWLIVVATLANQTGATVEVSESDLVLYDAESNTYLPEMPDAATSPPLVTATLTEGESVLGLARFAVPQGATPTVLEWCPGGNCDQAIQALVP